MTEEWRILIRPFDPLLLAVNDRLSAHSPFFHKPFIKPSRGRSPHSSHPMQDLLSPTPQTLAAPTTREMARGAIVTVLGFALYGFTVGYWRSPLMGVFVAVKMPLLIALTLGCNGLLNGLLGISAWQWSWISPIAPRSSQCLRDLRTNPRGGGSGHVFLGGEYPFGRFPASSLRPLGLPFDAYVHDRSGWDDWCDAIWVNFSNPIAARDLIARSTLAAWIAGNAFLGMQFSWIFRPFFGSPGLEVAFLREDPMKGSFIEAVWQFV